MKALADVRAVEFAYGHNGDFRLGPVTFEVRPREFLAVLGPNGSGKTTLLRLLAGMAVPQHGSVMFAGSEVSRLRPRERARRVAVVRQETPLVFPITVEQFVLQGRYAFAGGYGFESARDRDVAAAVMDATQTRALAARRICEISGGERQRAILARALAQEPELLLLDEPTAHLDISFQWELLRLVRRLAAEHDFGVVAVMHEINLASAFADSILLLSAGRIFRHGTPEDVLTADALEQVYGMPVRVFPDPQTGRPQVAVAPRV